MSPSRKLLYLAIAASAVLFRPTGSITYRTSQNLQPQPYTLTNCQPPPNYQNNNFHPVKLIKHVYRHNIPKKIRHAIRRAVNDLETLAYAVQHPKQAHWRWEN